MLSIRFRYFCRIAVLLPVMLISTGFSEMTFPETGCEGRMDYSKDICNALNEPLMTREYTVGGPGLFKAFTFSGDIEVTTVKNTDKAKIELYLDRGYSFWSYSKNLDNYRITMKKRGSQILSSVERKEKTGFFSDQMKFSYKVYLPEKMSTHLRTAGGDVSISGLSGDQSIQSNAGDIRINGVKGRLQAFTSGGNIDISDAEGTIFVQVNGGDIGMENSRGEMRLKLIGGTIKAEQISGTLVSKVEGGDINVHFAQIAKGVDLATTAGDISVKLPLQKGYSLYFKGSQVTFPSRPDFKGIRENDKIEGNLGEGGIPISLSTDHGSVSVTFNGRL